MLGKPIPILRIFSVDLATSFYVDFLGFKVDWEHRFGDNFPLYLQISRDDLILHLSEHFGDATPGSSMIIPVSDIEALHQQLSVQDYRYAKPAINEQPWGREIALTDPFGNRLKFLE
jgi:catechol 2,3-dioxygenase-like lactoylglutathione lyase family enzyme